MFFYKKLKKTLLLEPMFLGPNFMQLVRDKIFSEVEGTCIGKLGYIVSIVQINDSDIEPGHIDNDTGSVNVVVWYSAILFRPFTNEVVDAVVTNASDNNGFFCKVGPLKVYVSRHSMPEDITFDNIREDCWVSADGDIEIREGSVVRVRIMGLTLEATDMSATCTIKEDYLGLLEA